MLNAIHKRQYLIDSRQVNALSSLAGTGSFTETAHELFPSHSAISHSIQALKSHLGCRLLNSLGKKWIDSRFRALFNPHCQRNQTKRLTHE
jgi:DNA-binding transcriptional LysR family regulator